MALDFFDLERTKQYLDISGTNSDAILNEFALGSCQDIINFLMTMMEELPTGDNITDDIFDAVSFSVCAKYKASRNDYDGAKHYKEAYDASKESIHAGIELGANEEVFVTRRFFP